MAQEQKPGLRERKRAQSRANIRRAAVDLMTTHGFQDVTVEMICDEAEVSRRTFFNYFGSKEAVVVGHDPDPIPEDAQRAFVEGPRGSILADLARMLLTIISERPRDMDPKLWRARMDLIRSDETLGKALADHIAAKNDDLEQLVSRRIRARNTASGTPPGELEEQVARQSGFVVAMWWGIARYAIQVSLENPEADDEELVESILDTLTLIQEAEL